jgi:DNA-binding transcriptional LysR family regulator
MAMENGSLFESKKLMKVTSTNELDLRHLRIFLAVYAMRNVTRAADAVGLSQSSVSVVLSQLREHYGDPLFVRTSDGMKPTPRAEQLVPPVRQALQMLEQSLVPTAEFVPKDVARTFRISMTDVGQKTLLPRVLARVLQLSPNSGIEVANISHDTGRQLASGEVDLAMGFVEHLQAGFYRQKLFDEGFACIAARHHPRIVDRITLAQLQQERHVKVLVSATAHKIVDRTLERLRVRRSFAATVPSFLALGQMVASTELLAIVPLRLAAIFAAEGRIKIVAPPVNQFWHDRYHRDPANVWLRSVAYEIATSLSLADVAPGIVATPKRHKRA